jgi:hypothetical protein
MKVTRGVLVFFILYFLGSQLIGPIRCVDGWKSFSIGSQGACSYHGGVDKTPRNIVLIISVLGGIIASGYIGSRSSKTITKQSPANNDRESLANENYKRKIPPNCPKCGSRMVLRRAKKGSVKDEKFYGCIRYPRCKGIVNRSNPQ